MVLPLALISWAKHRHLISRRVRGESAQEGECNGNARYLVLRGGESSLIELTIDGEYLVKTDNLLSIRCDAHHTCPFVVFKDS